MWFLPSLSLAGDNLGWSTLAASRRPAPGIEPLVHHDRQSGTGLSPPCSRACLGPSCTAHTDLCRLSLCGRVSGPPPIALRDLLLRDPAAARCDPLPFSLLSSIPPACLGVLLLIRRHVSPSQRGSAQAEPAVSVLTGGAWPPQTPELPCWLTLNLPGALSRLLAVSISGRGISEDKGLSEIEYNQ